MSDESNVRESNPASLPDAFDLGWLRKQAKRRLREVRRAQPNAKLADAQFAVAKEYGFPVGARSRHTSIP